LPVLDGMMTSGLVAIEKDEVLQYGTTKPKCASGKGNFCSPVAFDVVVIPRSPGATVEEKTST
jgi:hypothetical protein